MPPTTSNALQATKALKTALRATSASAFKATSHSLQLLLLYSRTKGVKQKYLLYIYLIGSVQTILTMAMFNAQLHNWLTRDESIPHPYSALSSSGWLAVDESAPLPPQVLDELLAPPFLGLWGPTVSLTR